MEYTSPLQDDARGGPLGEEPRRLGSKQGQATMGPLGGDSGKETFGSLLALHLLTSRREGFAGLSTAAL